MRLYFRSEILLENELIIHALSEDQGSPTESVNLRTNEGDFQSITAFAQEVETNITSSLFPVSVNIPLFDGTAEVRFRIEKLDSINGTILAQSDWSNIIDSPGVHTQTMDLTTTWQSTDWVRLMFQIRRSGGHGNVEADISTQDVDSYVDIEFEEPTEEHSGGSKSVISITATGQGKKGASGGGIFILSILSKGEGEGETGERSGGSKATILTLANADGVKKGRSPPNSQSTIIVVPKGQGHKVANQFFTDFSEVTTGQLPSFLTKIWDPEAADAAVRELAGATGGKVFRVENGAGTSNRHRWTFTNIAEDTQAQEIFVRVRINIFDLSWAFFPSLRTSGTHETREMYYTAVTSVSSDRWEIGEADGSAFNRPEANRFIVPCQDDQWYIIGLRIGSGSSPAVSAKAWRDGVDSEPEWIDAQEFIFDISAGRPGIGSVADRIVEYDWVGIGVDGEEAPREPIVETASGGSKAQVLITSTGQGKKAASGDTFFEDWEGFDINDDPADHADWDALSWTTNDSRTIIDDNGDKILRLHLERDSDTGPRRYLRWSRIGDNATQELFMRGRQVSALSDQNRYPRQYVRTIDPDNSDGYELRNSGGRLRRINDGADTVLADIRPHIETPDVWINYLLTIDNENGDVRIRSKTWTGDPVDDEPASWDINELDDSADKINTQNPMGIGGQISGGSISDVLILDVQFVGAGVGGASAPREPVDDTVSGGSKAQVLITGIGQGAKKVSGDSKAIISITSTAQGVKGSSGGSKTTLLISPLGQGVKRSSFGSKSAILITGTAQGIKRASGGSKSSISTTVKGQGLKRSLFGSVSSINVIAFGEYKKAASESLNSTIEVSQLGSGSKNALGSSKTQLLINSKGDGSKDALGSSSSIVDIIPFGSGLGSQLGAGGSRSTIVVNSIGEGSKSVSGSSKGSVSVNGVSDGVKRASGGSKSSISTSTKSQGFKRSLSGSSSPVETIAFAQGNKHAIQGSRALISIGAFGSGESLAQASGGSKSTVSITSQGQGVKQSSESYISIIGVNSKGEGSKNALGESKAQLLIDSKGGGVKKASGSSKAQLLIDSGGDGSKKSSGGSVSLVLVSPKGQGQALMAGAGGSRSIVETQPKALGFKQAAGGSKASVSIDTSQEGVKKTSSSSASQVIVAPFGEGSSKEVASGGSKAFINITSNAQGVKQGQQGTTSIIVISPKGAGAASQQGAGGSKASVSIISQGKGNKSTSGSSISLTSVNPVAEGLKSTRASFSYILSIDSYSEGFKGGLSSFSSSISTNPEGDGSKNAISGELSIVETNPFGSFFKSTQGSSIYTISIRPKGSGFQGERPKLTTNPRRVVKVYFEQRIQFVKFEERIRRISFEKRILEVNNMNTLKKHPSSQLDYGFDWSSEIRPGDEIVESEWSLPAPTTIPALEIVVDSDKLDGARTEVEIKGGRPGIEYRVINTITTQQGRIDSRTLVIQVENR